MPKTQSDINRKTASRLLKVSVRTIDRYIRSGKLSAHQANGRIWLDKKEVANLPNIRIPVQRPAIDRSISVVRAPLADKKQNDETFYRDLYDEAKRALTEYQQKLELANYRIGQLESQIVHPVATKVSERHDDFHAAELLKKDLSDREKEITLLKDLVRREKASRIIFAILTYALLILQPVFWYLLR